MRRITSTLTALTLLAIITSTGFGQRPQRPDGAPSRDAERRRPERFNPLIRLFDADNDGSLSENEIDGAAAKLKELDKSKDGKLSEEELRASLPFGQGRPPFGSGGPPFGRGGSGRGPGGGSSSDLQKPTLAQDDAEKKILTALDEMRGGERFRNVSESDGRLLRLLAEAMGAKRVVEIGTSTGESAVWLALALQSTGGELFTHEIDAERAAIAKRNFEKAGVADLVTLIEGDAHETVKQYEEPIDILFLDADKEGYIDYLEKLLPLLRPGGLVVAHNMNTRQADPDYLKAITENPELETMILLKEGTGVGVTLKKR
jgi:predicted O-methyltransferase YrrM